MPPPEDPRTSIREDFKAMDEVTKVELEAMVMFVRRGIAFDGRISRILRTITEAAAFDGVYRNSTQAKKYWRRVSKGAEEMLTRGCTEQEYYQGTIFEHPESLRHIYRRLQALRDTLTPEMVWELSCKHEPVTVTRDEDEKLPDDPDAIKRYDGVIQIVELDEEPRKLFRRA
jgi:hypothetical protein